MSEFTEALIVSPLADGKTWVVLKPFGYDCNEEGSGRRIQVDIGFMTDFASVPRPLWILLPKWGKYGNAAVIHDWLYWVQRPDISRAQADHIFLEAMTVLNVAWWQKYPMYWAVRSFGLLAWWRNQWDRSEKFDRVLHRRVVKSIESSGRPGLLRRGWHRIGKLYMPPSRGDT
jgi:hypothetical protein